jgi:CDP-paratose 2-epimerase
VKILVTGGAGFVGTAVCTAFLSRGDDVVIIDDLSRVGSAKRLEILRGLGADRFVAHLVDITDRPAVEQAFEASAPFDAVVHLAAQVAVTWAMEDPHRDFLVNAAGSFHIADAVRRLSPGARCIYMASNKVYGELDDLGIVPSEDGERLVFRNLPDGVGSDRPLDPVTPYGVSKAAGECYFRDASRTYGLETIVLRASCIYGPKQSQQEDQGWVAWFAKAISEGLPLRVFGDGKTTRDMLFVGDLVDLIERILDGPAPPRGLTMNVGGGASAARSLLEVIRLLERLTGNVADMSFHPERPSDQKSFITDTSRAREQYGWSPSTRPEVGLRALLGLPDERAGSTVSRDARVSGHGSR